MFNLRPEKGSITDVVIRDGFLKPEPTSKPTQNEKYIKRRESLVKFLTENEFYINPSYHEVYFWDNSQYMINYFKEKWEKVKNEGVYFKKSKEPDQVDEVEEIIEEDDHQLSDFENINDDNHESDEEEWSNV